MMGRMEIIVDVARSAQGHLAGTVRPAGRVERRDFHGVMDLLACLERIIDVDASIVPDAGTAKESRPFPVRRGPAGDTTGNPPDPL